MHNVIIGVVLGFLLGLVPPSLARRRRLRAHWSALRAELGLCKKRANTLLTAGIAAPLYRLPEGAFKASYPVLLADGALNENEVSVLSEFYSDVQDLNRGLEYAAEALKRGDDKGLGQEYSRNLAKAANLVQDKPGQPSLCSQAKAILDAKIQTRPYPTTSTSRNMWTSIFRSWIALMTAGATAALAYAAFTEVPKLTSQLTIAVGESSSRSPEARALELLNYSGRPLKDMLMSDAQLQNARLPRAALFCSDFEDADFTDAILTGADLHDTNLKQATLDRADMTEAHLANADISGAKMASAVGITQSQIDSACADPADAPSLPPGTRAPDRQCPERPCPQ